MNGLKNRKFEPAPPLKPQEIEEVFGRFEETKGKDKGRVKFCHVTNEQLRSLKYVAKNVIFFRAKKGEAVHYDEDNSETESDEEKEEAVDFDTWKRRNGAGRNQKVFIIKGGYSELRKALTERGWFENEDVWSPHYDFKWTTRICDINFLNMRHYQAANHFNNNHHLTSKYGLARRLRTLALAHGIDADRFYPKCFDLGDQVDFENFIEVFKFVFAECTMKRFLVDRQRYQGLELKVRVAYDILKRRTQPLPWLVSTINRGKFVSVDPEEWAIITETAEGSVLDSDEASGKERLAQLRSGDAGEGFEIANAEKYEEEFYRQLEPRARERLERLQRSDPQFGMNGMRNVWIAKPNCRRLDAVMSRGRGIRCLNNLYDIADYCLGQCVQFVVQKYIENPLLVQGRKFDIRQWVLVQDFAPPKIWFYEECYVRFCADEYSLDHIGNRFMHLTNNSVQKLAKNHVAEKSMWSMGEFRNFVGAERWALIQAKLKDIVVWTIKACEGHVSAKKGSAELFGYDFMIDHELNPWLIEINMSPCMAHSTPVTKKLVPLVLQDTAKVLLGAKNKGLFTCIYKGDADLPNYFAYRI